MANTHRAARLAAVAAAAALVIARACPVLCAAGAETIITPEQAAAAKALEAVKAGAPADEVLRVFDAFCVAHFGAEKQPLVYDFFGRDLQAMDGGSWNHVSANSACIAWETNLPAKSQVEYGETAAYGSRTPEPERFLYVHVRALRDLKADTVYHYRTVSVDERGKRLVSPDATLTTKLPEGAIRVPGDLTGPPYKLDKSGATYVLEKDITAEGSAILVVGDGITLDLNGRAVTFAQGGADDKSAGVDARGSEKTKIKYQVSGFRLLNGAVRQGDGPGPAANKKSDAFNALRLVGGDIEIAGVTVEYRAPQSWGGSINHPFGAIDVHHNVFVDGGTVIADRHGSGVRPFGFINAAREANAFRIHHNLIARTRQNGFMGVGEMSHNEVYVDSWSTNSFALQPNSIPDVAAGECRYNRIFTTGFNPYGFGWAHKDLHVANNLVHMEGIGTKARWGESWGDIDMSSAMRVTNYGQGGQKRENLDYANNLIILRGREGCELRGTEFCADETIRDLVFRDGTISVVVLDDRTSRAACVDTHGLPKKADTVLPVFYRNCAFLTNICHVRFGDSYAIGSNHRFVNCKFVRLGNDPRYHTFIFGAAYWSRRHVFLDCDFSSGARYDDVFWERTANTSDYSIQWTLSLKTAPGAKVTVTDKDGNVEFAGAAGADGIVAAALTQCVIRPKEWKPGVKEGAGLVEVKLRGEHQEIAMTPHAVTVELDGKTATKSVTMDRKQSLELMPK